MKWNKTFNCDVVRFRVKRFTARVVPNESGPSETLFGNLPAEYKTYSQIRILRGNSILVTHRRLSMARPLGRDMGRLPWVHFWSMCEVCCGYARRHYLHVIDRVISAFGNIAPLTHPLVFLHWHAPLYIMYRILLNKLVLILILLLLTKIMLWHTRASRLDAYNKHGTSGLYWVPGVLVTVELVQSDVIEGMSLIQQFQHVSILELAHVKITSTANSQHPICISGVVLA